MLTKNRLLDKRRTSEVILTVLAAIFLLIAVTGRHSYAFICCSGFCDGRCCLLGLEGLRNGTTRLGLAFATAALLMKPFLPIHMHRADWQPVDMSLGVLLFAGLCIGLSAHRSNREAGNRPKPLSGRSIQQVLRNAIGLGGYDTAESNIRISTSLRLGICLMSEPSKLWTPDTEPAFMATPWSRLL